MLIVIVKRKEVVVCGLKSRGNYPTGGCIKNCANRGKVCKSCLKFNKFKLELVFTPDVSALIKRTYALLKTGAIVGVV